MHSTDIGKKIANMAKQLHVKPIDMYFKVLEQQTLVKSVLKSLMLDRLKGKVHDPEEFCKWLKKTGAVMCGSFPLQIALNEEWEGSDIDIYVMDADPKLFPMTQDVDDKTQKRVIDLERTKNYLTRLVTESTSSKGINWDDVIKDDIGKTIFAKVLNTPVLCSSVDTYSKFGCLLKFGLKERSYWGTTSSSGYDTSLITDIGEYNYSSVRPCDSCVDHSGLPHNCENKCYEKCKNTKIQIIHLNPKFNKTIKEFVSKFDFDFCKVMFDGEDFTILEPQSLITRSSVYNKVEDWHNQKDKRIAKYIKRGFTINEPKSNLCEQCKW